MDFVVQNWYLFLVAIVSGGLLLWPALTKGGGGAQRVAPGEAVQLMNRERACVVDVSEPAEWAAGHVIGSRNVPLASLEGAAGDLPKNKALPVIVVCANGARSPKAVAALRKLGYEKVLPLAGGLAAWRDAGLPLEKAVDKAALAAEKAAEKAERAAKAAAKAAAREAERAAATAASNAAPAPASPPAGPAA